MKRHNRKPKPKAGTGFDEAGTLEPATGFDFAHLYAHDEGVDADLAHGLTRDEAETWLQEQGLSRPDRALVVGRVFDQASVRELEAATGWRKSRIAQRLKSATIRQAIADLRSGRARPGKLPTLPAPAGQSLTLLQCAALARKYARHFGFPEHNLDAVLQSKPDRPLAWHYVNVIRQRPATLLHPEHGRRCVEALVDLLEAATLGDSKRRVAGVVPEGTRKAIMAAD